MSDSNKSAGIAKLEGNELGWSNLVSFQRKILDYASSKHTAVMESIKDGEDMDPPAEHPPNAPPSEHRSYDRLERHYTKYVEAKLSVCANLFASCSNEIQSRFNQSIIASYKRKGEVGKIWAFIKEIVKGAGFLDAMTHLTDMFSYRISSPENVGNDYTKYVDSIEAIKTQYPDDVESIKIMERYQNSQVCPSSK